MAVEIRKQTDNLKTKAAAARAVPRTIAKEASARIPRRESPRDRLVAKTRVAGLGALGGAAGAYLLDPRNGRRRRAMARDRAAALVRRGARATGDKAGAATTAMRDSAAGAFHGARRATEGERPAANDQELADRVQTQIFRPEEAPKGSVSVNAEAGIVYLRGEVEDAEKIAALVAAATEVDGVRAVENLLHGPEEPAPMKEETEPETRRRVLGFQRS